MTHEIAALRGRLAAAEKTLEGLSVSLDCDIDTLRGLADKYEDKNSLDGERIALTAVRISSGARQYRELTGVIKKLKADLGEE